MLMSPIPDEGGAPVAAAMGNSAQNTYLVADVLDPKHVAQLCSLKVGGKKTLFHELCTILSREAPARMIALRQAVADKDAETASRLSHAFVGSAASIGARQLQSCMRSLELSASECNWPQILASMKAVDLAWERLLVAIEEKQKEVEA